MASDANEYFGFELLNRIVDGSLSKKEDVLVLFVHWYFVKNGFKCIGFGDSKVLEPATDRGSDFLPTEWNGHPNYTLRYAKDGKLYILVAVKTDADLLFNFLRVVDNAASSVQFPIEKTVAVIHGPLDRQIPDHRGTLSKVRKDLVEPLHDGAGRETATQTTARVESPEQRRDPDDDPLRVRAEQPPRIPRQPWNPQADPRNIGRSDLDPFSRDGGGMIFDPFSGRHGIPSPFGPRPGGLGVPGRLPPGAVPPGARFDPFGPPDIDGRPHGRPRDPDADHLPPPGYDDMFM